MEEFGIRIVPEYYDATNSTIKVKDCLAFSVTNEGDSIAYLNELIAIQPNEVVPFPNVANLPFSENLKLEFATGGTSNKVLVVKGVKVKMICNVG